MSTISSTFIIEFQHLHAKLPYYVDIFTSVDYTDFSETSYRRTFLKTKAGNRLKRCHCFCSLSLYYTLGEVENLPLLGYQHNAAPIFTVGIANNSNLPLCSSVNLDMESIELKERKLSSCSKYDKNSCSQSVAKNEDCSISGNNERLLTKELTDNEREIQLLIQKYLQYREQLIIKSNLKTTLRPLSDNAVKLKNELEKRNNSKTVESNIEMQTSNEINTLRRAMQKLRRWKNGSQQFTYRNMKKLREFLFIAKNKFILTSLQILYQEKSYFSLQTSSKKQNVESVEDEIVSEDLWTILQSKIKKNIENGVPLFKIENIFQDIETLWSNLQQL
ncbi:hypothetical protein HELRODRAFT_164383 [Helobdella robusta]|uniref:Uncharacterized protein n=1 Tax=Helobdella robusta TaxID=6412 RepID=T1EVC9_HELRO|nr:hypothetical protein HELRODRAFT_164383 [Helobdella robusta]ESN94527.1 hypothetical protein HELRODRAFT_164383 [Helobdella robusta]